MLNYFAVKHPDDLRGIIASGQFAFNTRVVKYLLNCDGRSFAAFAERYTENFLSELYDCAIGNEYHLFDSYLDNIRWLEARLGY